MFSARRLLAQTLICRDPAASSERFLAAGRSAGEGERPDLLRLPPRRARHRDQRRGAIAKTHAADQPGEVNTALDLNANAARGTTAAVAAPPRARTRARPDDPIRSSCARARRARHGRCAGRAHRRHAAGREGWSLAARCAEPTASRARRLAFDLMVCAGGQPATAAAQRIMRRAPNWRAWCATAVPTAGEGEARRAVATRESADRLELRSAEANAGGAAPIRRPRDAWTAPTPPLSSCRAAPRSASSTSFAVVARRDSPSRGPTSSMPGGEFDLSLPRNVSADGALRRHARAAPAAAAGRDRRQPARRRAARPQSSYGGDGSGCTDGAAELDGTHAGCRRPPRRRATRRRRPLDADARRTGPVISPRAASARATTVSACRSPAPLNARVGGQRPLVRARYAAGRADASLRAVLQLRSGTARWWVTRHSMRRSIADRVAMLPGWRSARRCHRIRQAAAQARRASARAERRAAMPGRPELGRSLSAAAATNDGQAARRGRSLGRARTASLLATAAPTGALGGWRGTSQQLDARPRRLRDAARLASRRGIRLARSGLETGPA